MSRRTMFWDVGCQMIEKTKWSLRTEIRMIFYLVATSHVLFTNFVKNVARFHFCPEALWELDAVFGPLCVVAWFIRNGTALFWGNFSGLSWTQSKHWAVWPLCFPRLVHERRYLPAISCADRLGMKPPSQRGNGRTDWIRLVIWED